ncbi:toll/interleukin-1 receptor domain-containing protein [Actinokineospora inagensis]|uniref:toll/interleukin-1 receptor domain-containing protein n=1 Tax=Actinokineospora inagensis TaxID=103730 RepID=UPI000424D42E|nr:toll/interleukin-1 receptor domain-containing protein [Actinokineospora inagensis]
MQVFVSHAPSDRDVAAALRADLAQLGRQVALDRGEPTGAHWWDGVLHRVRRCDVFILVTSPAAVRSPGCLATLRYARALRRPVLLVSAAATGLPPEAETAPLFEPSGLDISQRIPKLRGALLALPPAPPLPDPLPLDPAVPYLDPIRQRLDEPQLDPTELRELVRQLRLRLRDEGERAAVWGLLVRMRARTDLPPPLAAEVEKVLAPGWQPDPERRVEKRYWDGQAWTTLVRHENREFNERRVPPPEATWSGDPVPARPRPTAPAPVKPVVSRPKVAPRLPSRKRLLVIGGGVVVVAAVVVSGVLIFSAGSADPTTTARDFVDAVNVADVSALQEVTCTQNRSRAADLFLRAGAHLSLERVDESADPPTFTVLATDSATTNTDRRTYSMVEESGKWLVCQGS